MVKKPTKNNQQKDDISKDDIPRDDIQRDDIIEGEASVVSEEGQPPSSSKKASDKKSASTAGRPAKTKAPLFSYLALLSGLAGVAMGGYLLMIYQEQRAEIALLQTQMAADKAAFASTLKNLEPAQRQLSSMLSQLEERQSETAGHIAELDEKVRILTPKASETSGDFVAEKQVILMMWDASIEGRNLSVYRPAIELLADARIQNSLRDILALAGTSTHAGLLQEAHDLSRDETAPQAADAVDAADEGVVSSVVNWLGDFLNLKEIDAAQTSNKGNTDKITQTGSSKSSGAVSSGIGTKPADLKAALALLKDSQSAAAEAWRIRAGARQKADEALRALLPKAIVTSDAKATGTP